MGGKLLCIISKICLGPSNSVHRGIASLPEHHSPCALGNRPKGEHDGNVELIRGERAAGLLTGQAEAAARRFSTVLAQLSLVGLGGTPANVIRPNSVTGLAGGLEVVPD
jgi:hypothetical protein